MEIANRLKQVQPSATLQITARAKLLKRQGSDVVNLAAGEPDFDTPNEIKKAAIKAIKEGFTKYTPASGIPELKEAISRKLNAENSLDYISDQIIISCGAKHSLYNTLQAIVNPGDEVIIISPYWLSYPQMVRLAGAKPVFLETNSQESFKPDFNKLIKLIGKKTKAIIINSPANPTGILYSLEELNKIADIALKKDLLVISDEIYEKLIYDGQKHFSIGSLNSNIFKNTITINGVSKTYSMTGWRIGYLAAPTPIAKAVASLQSHSTSNPTSISQKAALAALSLEPKILAPFITEFTSRRDCLVENLKDIPEVSFTLPQGAFYMFVDISGLGLSPHEFSSQLLEEEFVAVIPGESFGAPKRPVI